MNPQPVGSPGPKQPDRKDDLQSSKIAEQRPSEGGKLKGMSFLELVNLFFSWLVALFMPKKNRDKIINDIISGISDSELKLTIEWALFQYKIEPLKKIESVLEHPEAKRHLISAAQFTPYQILLDKFVDDPEKAKQVFQNFALAQNLVKRRIDNQKAYKINAFFLEEPIEVQKNLKAFLDEASRLQKMNTPKEKKHLVDLKPNLKNLLAQNLLQEIVSATDLPASSEQAVPLSIVGWAADKIRVGYGNFPLTGDTSNPNVRVAATEIDNQLEVRFTSNNRTYIARYEFLPGESKQELVSRIRTNGTLEHDLLLAIKTFLGET